MSTRQVAPVMQILEMARWAPSGDNTQPWRFEIVDDLNVIVHGFDTRDHCVYDLDGHPSQMSIGAMLETASIAASLHGLRMDAQRKLGGPDTTPTFQLGFTRDAKVAIDPLHESITTRCVQRRPMSLRQLTDTEKQELEKSVGSDYRILWLEGMAKKLSIARLLFNNAHLRLTLPEAYSTHRDVIEWNVQFSTDKVPDQALGVDPLTAKIMHWAMASWERVSFLNQFLGGTWAPRIQMDLIPSIACGAHFLLVGNSGEGTIDSYIAGGRALQRFWLNATRLGLHLQPEMTPLIFARYAVEGVKFSKTRSMLEFAQNLSVRFEGLVGKDAARCGIFMGRLGAGPGATSRSTRRPLASLLVDR